MSLTASASYSNNTSRVVTPSWTSNSSAATVAASGVVTAGSVTSDTSVTITASYTEGGVTKQATFSFTVKPSPLSGLSISGGTSPLAVGSSFALTATATYANNTSRTVTPTWSSNSAAATITTAGAVTANSVTLSTIVTITASYTEGGVTQISSYSFTVAPPTLNTLSISGGSSQLTAGSSFALTATAGYSNSTSKTVTPTWTSSSAAASVTSAGTVTANSVLVDSAVTITATYSEGGVTRQATYSFTVKPPPLVSLSIVGGSSQLSAGTSFTLTATANYGNGTSKTVTPTWTSSSAAASVTSSGTVIANSVTINTPVIITATYTEGGVTQQASLSITVLSPAPTSLSIQGTDTLQSGGTATLLAIASYPNGTTKSVSPAWISSNAAVAYVGTSGALTAGSVTADTVVILTASFTENGSTVTATFTLTVKLPPLVSIAINGPTPAVVQAGKTITLTVTATYGDNTTRTVTPTWSSTSTATASVNSSGVVTGGAVLVDTSVLINAAYAEGSVSKTTFYSLTVKPAPPCTVTATPSIAGGYAHVLALRKDGTVWSWGWSFFGQAGNAESKTRSTPALVSGVTCVTAIAAGAGHNLALRSDGTVMAWGHNGQGGLGNESTNDAYSPVSVSGLADIRSVAAGIFHSLALTNDGTVYAWGEGRQGQLGDGNGQSRQKAAAVPGLTGIKAIAANLNYSLALGSEGSVWGWGDLGAAGSASTPVQIGTVSGVTTLAAGWGHTLALKADGTVWAWGGNARGQLGLGDTQDRSAPVQIPGLSEVKAISAGLYHSVAVRNDGSVWSWGSNESGQHGDGGNSARLVPQAVDGMSNAAAIAAHYDYTIVLKNDGYVWGAGYNGLGQLGDGSFVHNARFAPVQDADSADFLDLAPGQAKETVPAPKFFMQSEKYGDENYSQGFGSYSNLSLKSRIRRNAGSFAADDGIYQLFIAILVPEGKPGLTASGAPGSAVSGNTLFFKTSGLTWQRYAGGAIPAYMSNVAGSQVDTIALDILRNTDLSRMSGAQFYVGYGTTPEDMIAAERYRLMLVVP